MSNIAQGWAWKVPVGGVVKLVLIALADHSDDEGFCWPGVRGIAAKCGITQRTVEHHTAELARLGWLRVEPQHRPDGSRRSNLYCLNLQTTGGPGENSSPGGGELSSPGSEAFRGTRTPIEPSFLEPSSTGDNNPNPEIAEDQTLWPKWYALCYSVPGWKTDLVLAAAWLRETGISENLAEIKAYALRDWWDRLPTAGKRRQEGDPYKTWQNWCRQDRDKYVPAKGADHGKPGPHSGQDETDWDAVRREFATPLAPIPGQSAPG